MYLGRHRFVPLAALVLLPGTLIGCASPGLPRAPSLSLPAAVKNLSAERVGPAVSLRFTVPQRTTDDLAIRTPTLGLRVCREVPPGSCTPLPQFPNTISTKNPQGDPNTLTLTDTLPTELTLGEPRVIRYRVQLVNGRGRPGPLSDPAHTATGRAPAPVAGFTAAGSRLGILLGWSPAPLDDSEVILQRELVQPATDKPPKKSELLLRATDDPKAAIQNRTLDTSAEDGTLYRYTAYRERKVTLGGRTLTLRSEPTLPVAFTLHDTFPPPTPTDLTAAAFTTDGNFSVDLIWQPVEDPGLAGYLVYREAPGGPRTRLTPTPLTLPDFHDTNAKPAVPYRYSVTSIDRKGNESPAATTSTP